MPDHVAQFQVKPEDPPLSPPPEYVAQLSQAEVKRVPVIEIEKLNSVESAPLNSVTVAKINEPPDEPIEITKMTPRIEAPIVPAVSSAPTIIPQFMETPNEPDAVSKYRDEPDEDASAVTIHAQTGSTENRPQASTERLPESTIHLQQRGAISNGAKILSQLEQFLSQPGILDNESKKKPIRFKDAVGRKFSFPFHLCATWAVSYNHYIAALRNRAD